MLVARTYQRAKQTLAALLAVGCLATLASGCGTSFSGGVASPTLTWMRGVSSPGTPVQFDSVGVLRFGSSGAKNVLVLEPGTSAGSAYFAPLAEWIVAKAPGWQVWSVERRENLLENQTELTLYKEGKATVRQMYDFYFGPDPDPTSSKHFQTIPTSAVEFAKQWGMAVAVGDLRKVVTAAEKLGGKVVLGGHSLGGAVVTAYATWDFGGRPGADGLAGLVYIDGGSLPGAPSGQQASQELQQLDAPASTPWLAFGGIPAPYAGIFNATGSAAALLDPNAPSLAQQAGILPTDIDPPVRVTNLGQYGYALDVGTSPAALIAGQAHLGKGLAAAGPVHGWDGKGALTPIDRYATMFSGAGIPNVDGTEWYFPQRLFDDSAAVDNGNANAAQVVLGMDATMGHDLPRSLLVYAFGAALGGAGVPADAQLLAEQSGIPAGNLTLVDRHTTYAHNDPAGAYPGNAFVQHLIPFLARAAGT